ncbi:hypothetical protein BDF14DRAFT_119703 [Spinellus fusiger]|nr:hypothetical protein BDF14DRAFT_119703 [Spinellus fusiger]
MSIPTPNTTAHPPPHNHTQKECLSISANRQTFSIVSHSPYCCGCVLFFSFLFFSLYAGSPTTPHPRHCLHTAHTVVFLLASHSHSHSHSQNQGSPSHQYSTLYSRHPAPWQCLQPQTTHQGKIHPGSLSFTDTHTHTFLFFFFFFFFFLHGL